jgi:hypothetical protein
LCASQNLLPEAISKDMNLFLPRNPYQRLEIALYTYQQAESRRVPLMFMWAFIIFCISQTTQTINIKQEVLEELIHLLSH